MTEFVAVARDESNNFDFTRGNHAPWRSIAKQLVEFGQLLVGGDHGDCLAGQLRKRENVSSVKLPLRTFLALFIPLSSLWFLWFLEQDLKSSLRRFVWYETPSIWYSGYMCVCTINCRITPLSSVVLTDSHVITVMRNVAWKINPALRAAVLFDQVLRVLK